MRRAHLPPVGHLVGMLLAGLVLASSGSPIIHDVRAAPIWVVSLDAQSTSQTDISVASSATNAKSFRIGAIINASRTLPLADVYGWAVTIDYNASAFVPQGDPGGLVPYPDGAEGTVFFGEQTEPGTINWAGLVGEGKAWGSFHIERPGKVAVFWTLLGQTSAVTIFADTLLANVNFELLNKPANTQSFSISDVEFAQVDGKLIQGVVAGPSVWETVTNDPPHAKFVVAAEPSLGPFIFTFNASLSTDSDDNIPDPGGYFWDFGDGTTDLGITGRVVTHDFGPDSRFMASLRVEDSSGASGSGRNSRGEVISNFQPSHAHRTAGSIPTLPPAASISFYPNPSLVGEGVHFMPFGNSDPDGTILFWNWDLGDGTTISLTQPGTVTHTYSEAGNYSVVLTVVDDGNESSSTTAIVSVVSLLVLTSFGLVEPAAFTTEKVTLQAMFTGGTAPFKCTFFFGDGDSMSVTTNDHKCSATHTYWNEEPRTASVRVRETSLADDVQSQMTFGVEPQPGFSGNELAWVPTISLGDPQTFTVNLANPTTVPVLIRLDLTITKTGGSDELFISPSYTLSKEQTRTGLAFTYLPSGGTGTYCLKARLRYGIDSDGNSILENSEVLGNRLAQSGCFTIVDVEQASIPQPLANCTAKSGCFTAMNTVLAAILPLLVLGAALITRNRNGSPGIYARGNWSLEDGRPTSLH